MRTNLIQSKPLAIFAVAILAGTVLAGCVEEGGDGDKKGDGGMGATAIKTTCGNNALSLGDTMMDDTNATSAFETTFFTPAQRLALRPDAVQQGMGTLKLGSLLPLTGALQDYGGDMEKAVRLAVKDLNAAAGGLATVELHPEDSKSSKDDAPAAMNKLVSEGVTAVVGAASSGVTDAILSIAIQNKVVVTTPASTAPSLTADRDNEGYFWRIPPSDALQGKILANLVKNDGCGSAAVVALNNPYGQGLAKQFAETFTGLGGTMKGEVVYFAEDTPTFPGEIEKLSNAKADAIVFIGYPGQGVPFMKQSFERGLMSEGVFFFSEGVKSAPFPTDTGKTTDGAFILAGLGGTTPADLSGGRYQAFVDKFTTEYGAAPGLFAAESYDAAIAIALAAVAAQSTDGADIKDKMQFVWNSPGQKTGILTEALALLAAGQDIDWQGASSDANWNDVGDPEGGNYSYWVVTADGTIASKAIPQ